MQIKLTHNNQQVRFINTRVKEQGLLFVGHLSLGVFMKPATQTDPKYME
jgi:hypothetical protein